MPTIREEMLRRQKVEQAQQESEQEDDGGGSVAGVAKLLQSPALERIMEQAQQIGEAYVEGQNRQTGQTARS